MRTGSCFFRCARMHLIFIVAKRPTIQDSLCPSKRRDVYTFEQEASAASTPKGKPAIGPKAGVEARTAGDTRLSRTGVEMTAAARLFVRDKLADRVPKSLRGKSRRRRAECLRSPVSRHLSRSLLSCLLQDGRQSLGNHSDRLAWLPRMRFGRPVRYSQENSVQAALAFYSGNPLGPS